ncbi:hydroxymethylglutaryl-CoA reductase, degradative [Allomyces macrogynus ATCC 38327]|uniref:hydroxymethylglutaryl-CoA reductase (NADPH) n=1 Tax=Allomyces macrogynus (strain ATCC 38327) TaxID=578462 RepID=A0A0L0RV84_ALLM3|nr:hydroxymethylglutaryl-CoA reductase, degradative [Allomyces macrogynus ATCC 38327]|eukprot:KNE54228.1 hydroxymethylglutaryl-CoA reductase, degradative [Allomyces macrogynus ATCC 38327]
MVLDVSPVPVRPLPTATASCSAATACTNGTHASAALQLPHSTTTAAPATAATRTPPQPTGTNSAPRPLYEPAWVEDWAYANDASRASDLRSLHGSSTSSLAAQSVPSLSSAAAAAAVNSRHAYTSSLPAMVPPPPPEALADQPLTITVGSQRAMSGTLATVPDRLGSTQDIRPSIWSGFYKKALKERQAQLRLAFPHLFPATTTVKPLVHGAAASLATASDSPPQSPSLADSGQAGGKPSGLGRLHGVVLSPNASLSASGASTTSLSSAMNGGAEDNFPIRGLDERIADNMVENCIGTMGMPVGLALNFVIDGVPTVVPMAVEEPSVVAAVSGAAKTLSSSDAIGFVTTTPDRNIITAQILLLDVPQENMAAAQAAITAKKKAIISFANQFCSNMYKRGGGVVDMLVRRVRRSAPDSSSLEFLREQRGATATINTEWLVVHLHIDVCDAMGANCASTVAEGTAPMVADLAGPRTRVGVRIVTNLNPARLSSARFRVPVEALAYKSFTGAQVAARLLDAYQWASDDPYRATTHNKGIMNGIDAVALATGQDWRAVEAACHSWAAGNGLDEVGKDARRYSSMTRYWTERDPETGAWMFCGELVAPIIVGTKGGVLATAPLYQYTLGMMGFPDSKRLAAIMCCVGLAQNFAALRALSTEGIQRGHMHLHARNIAIAAGAPTHAIAEVTQWMIEKGRINVDAAKEYITAHHLYTKLRKKLSTVDASALLESKPPSMFFFQEAKDRPLTLNIAFQTLGDKPVFLDFTDTAQSSAVHAVLLGGKTYEWLMNIFPVVDAMRLPLADGHTRANDALCKRLKVLSLILNVLLRRLMIWCPGETRNFIDKIFSQTRKSVAATGSQGGTIKRESSIVGNGGGSSSGRSRTLEKRPSIFKYIQKILAQNAKLESATAKGTPLLAAVNGTGDPASPKSARPHTPSPLSQLLATVSVTDADEANVNAPLLSGADLSTSGADWSLPDSGVFRSDLFDDELHLHDAASAPSLPSASLAAAGSEAVPPRSGSNTSLSAIPTKREILQVGFPLVLAIWQVFELWVAQYVGPSALAAHLLEEQRVIVSSLVATHEDMVPADMVPYMARDTPIDASHTVSAEDAHDAFAKYLAVQAKRAQCTLFLLVDLIAHDPTQITLPVLAAVRTAGHYLEHEATVVHDVARLARDHRVVFGPGDDIAADLLLAGRITRSPESPQLRFRRRSLFPSAAAAHAAAVMQAGSPFPDNHVPNGSLENDLIEFHPESVRNSVLIYAMLRAHCVAKASEDALALAAVTAVVPEYVAHLDLEKMRARMAASLARQAATTAAVSEAPVDPLGFAFLDEMSEMLREKFGVKEVMQRG